MPERHSTPPKFWPEGNTDQQLRKIVQTVGDLQRGLLNNWEKVALAENETVTEVLVEYATEEMIAIFSPQDEATALEIAAGTIWATVETGKVVMHHGSASGTRTLGVAILG